MGMSCWKAIWRQIKAGYGNCNVQIKYDGDARFLQESRLVQSFNDYGNYVEVRLAPGADTQELLRLASAGARLSKFEVMEPSLEEIFIEAVSKPAVNQCLHPRTYRMRNFWVIIKREYLQRVRTRSFLILTLLVPGIMTVVMLLPAKLATMGEKAQHIVVVTSTPQFGEMVRQHFLSAMTATDDDDDEPRSESGEHEVEEAGARRIRH